MGQGFVKVGMTVGNRRIEAVRAVPAVWRERLGDRGRYCR